MTSGLARSQAAGGKSPDSLAGSASMRPSRKVALKGLPGAAASSSVSVADLSPEGLEALVQSGDLPWREISIHIAAHSDRALLVRELVRLSESASHVEVRYKAKKLLSRLGGATVPGVPVANTTDEAPRIGELARTLGATEPAARLKTFRSFAEAHGADGADEFIACLHSQEDVTLVSSALAAFSRIAEARHIDALRFFLKHPSDRVVASAVESVGRIDPENAFTVVLPVILREDNRVRANVLMVLYRYQKWTVLANIQRMARSRNESYRASALWCLGQIRDEEVDEIVLSMIEAEESPELLEKQVELLCRIGGHRVVPGLTAMAAQPARREIARQILARITMREDAAAASASPVSTATVALPSPAAAHGTRLATRSSERRGLSSERKALGTARLKPAAAPDPARADRGLARPVAALMVVLALFLVRILVPSSTPDDVSEVTSKGPASKVSERRAWIAGTPSASGPAHRILGTVVGVRGDYVLVKKDGLLYACRKADGSSWKPLEAGQELLVQGKVAGWDPDHGFYRIEVEGAD